MTNPPRRPPPREEDSARRSSAAQSGHSPGASSSRLGVPFVGGFSDNWLLCSYLLCKAASSCKSCGSSAFIWTFPLCDTRPLSDPLTSKGRKKRKIREKNHTKKNTKIPTKTHSHPKRMLYNYTTLFTLQPLYFSFLSRLTRGWWHHGPLVIGR